jgi:type II secretory pathway component PulL
MSKNQNAGAVQEAIYEVARYVGIQGDKMEAWLGAMRMCGFEVSAVARTEATPIKNVAQDWI